MILLYQDYVHNSGHVHKALTRQFGAANVTYADAHDILNGVLTRDIRAFVMPGGASRYVADKLDGEGNALIRRYVEQGGVYIGICAGAYYACRRTEWLQDQDNAICVDNELNFFSGIAQGPIAAFTRHDLERDYSAACTTLKTSNGLSFKTLYRGGPLFKPDALADFTTLASYMDLPGLPPAVITGMIGNGRYILSSPHIEYNDMQLNLAQFDVVANRQADLALLPTAPGLNGDYFFNCCTIS
jgi:glutamine amidotransferase-like uncharacterized protein